MQDIFQGVVDRYNLNSETPGLCAFIKTENEQSVFSIGSERAKGDSIKTQSNFRLASITKQFTAVSILQLVERGLLSLDTKLNEIFPSFPHYGKSITIHHLLNHTSGLPDYEKYLDSANSEQISDESVLEIVSKNKPLFLSGTKYSYSNGAYCLLALIIACRSGMSFEEYLKRNIFEPAGMKNSRLNTDASIPHRVYGYSLKGSKWIFTDQDKTSKTQGDGGIYSSVDDLVRWQTSLYENCTLLSKEYLKTMIKPSVPTEQQDYYGFGIHISELKKLTYYYHVGESIGFRNILLYIPEIKGSVGILSNFSSTFVEPLGKEILKKLSEKF